jgi:hypothetical protein
MSNVQLSGGEVSVVWVDVRTKRIIGFSPEGARVVAPRGTRLASYTLLHASDMDHWMNKYREQCQQDREEATVRKLERERPLRAAIREAVMERNKHLDVWNRDVNLRMLNAGDAMYERILESRRKAEVALAAERFDASKNSLVVGRESPFIKNGTLDA